MKKKLMIPDDDEDEDDEDEDENQEEEKEKKKKDKKKVFHFEYNVKTKTLRELKDWEGPDDHPDWANVSPDGKTVVFARNNNLFKISKSDYQKVLDARRGKDKKQADKITKKLELEEIQLTKNGEEDFSYANSSFWGRGKIDTKKKKKKMIERKSIYPGPEILKSLP